MATIRNGSDYPITDQMGTVPNMMGSMDDWMQNLIFEQIVKTVIAGQVVETTTPINFWGVLQPLNGRELLLKPEGQRAWNWITVHTQIVLPLRPDDVIIFQSKQYRVMASKNYSIYSVYYYELGGDWTGSGPEVTA